MNRTDIEYVSSCLQEAADHLCAGLPDRLNVWIGHKGLNWSLDGWSSALSRTKFHVAEPGVLRTLPANVAQLHWRDAALPFIETVLGKVIERIRQRHASAEALGLVQGDRYEGLPSARMKIDRVLKGLLVAAGIDFRGAAATISAARPGELDLYLFELIGLEITADDWLWVVHEGIGAPTIQMSQPLALGSYDGTSFEMPMQIPETAMVLASGRRLGEVVETGLPALDQHRVRAVSAEIWDHGVSTRFEVEPDLVELGPPADG